MLRRIGSALLVAGAALGTGVGLALMVGFRPAGLSWLVAVGLTKLTLAAAGSIMAAGAFCLRLDNRRRAARLAAPAPSDSDALPRG